MKLTLTVVLLLLACGCVTEIIPARMQSSTRTALERPGTQLGEAVRLEVGAGEEDVTLSVGGHTAVLPAGRSGALQVSSTEAHDYSRERVEGRTHHWPCRFCDCQDYQDKPTTRRVPTPAEWAQHQAICADHLERRRLGIDA